MCIRDRDIEFAGMRCIAECDTALEHNKWARIEGKVHIAVNEKEDQRVPVIHVSKTEDNKEISKRLKIFCRSL